VLLGAKKRRFLGGSEEGQPVTERAVFSSYSSGLVPLMALARYRQVQSTSTLGFSLSCGGDSV
jgi:hypothetical protein